MTPSARITVNGKDISTRLIGEGGVLVELTLTDEAGTLSDTCELVIDNGRGFAAPPIGAEIAVWLGYEPQPILRGRYRVTGWTKAGAPNLLTVRGTSADLTSALKSTKLRGWHGTSVGAIVRKIAHEHGLTAVVDDALAGLAIAHIDQQTESDLNFLSRLARRIGAAFRVADGKVIFSTRGSASLPSGVAKAAVTIKPSDTSSWSVTREARSDFDQATAYYIDPATHRRHAAHAGSGAVHRRDKRVYGSSVEARAAANAELAERKRNTKRAEFEGMGNPALYAEAQVALSGFDQDVDGLWLTTSVTHRLDSSGYTSSVELEAAG